MLNHAQNSAYKLPPAFLLLAPQGQGPAAVLPADPLPTVLCASGFGPEGLLRISGRKLREVLAAPQPALFWAAGFSFSRAQVLLEVGLGLAMSGIVCVCAAAAAGHIIRTILQWPSLACR